MSDRHPALDMPAPKGLRCPACRHWISDHREAGCDVVVTGTDVCECTAPYGRIMPADPAPTWRAADLPEGSVVATEDRAWIKSNPWPLYPWNGSDGSEYDDQMVDEALANGAQVLRVGTGKEG